MNMVAEYRSKNRKTHCTAVHCKKRKLAGDNLKINIDYLNHYDLKG